MRAFNSAVSIFGFSVLMSAALTACSSTTYVNPVPATRFYFPSGLAHVERAGSTEGLLFVANANFDKRYQGGSLGVVNLDEVRDAQGQPMPAFGAAVVGGPRQLTELGTNANTISISSFAGEMAKLELSPNRYRFFIPSRSEGMKFQAVDAVVASDGTTKLSCFPPAPEGHESDCSLNAPSLSPAEFEQSTDGVPRATSPYGVALGTRACTANADCGGDRVCTNHQCKTANGDAFSDVWVTHIQQVDSPIASGLNYRGYLVHLESDLLAVAQSNYVNLGTGAGSSAVAGQRWVYTTGRYYNPTTNVLRMVDRSGTVYDTGLQSEFAVLDARGITLGSSETRAYIVGRTPDVLMVVRVTNPTADYPGIQLMHAIPLASAPNEVKLIPRAGRGDLLAITSSGAGVVSVYDDDVGDLVAQVTDVGLQPFSIDVSQRGAGVRLFVSDFNDGRVAVLDMPDLNRPQDVRIVAHVGAQQLCLTRPSQTAGCTTQTTGVAP